MKVTQILAIIAGLSALTGQVDAASSADPINKLRRHHSSTCRRCVNGPIDIRQGPGFWNQNINDNINPYTDEIYDEDPYFDDNFF